ncbi:hypothetical protein DV736_g391, partial [Chaetothyriales sp. CBS 134916]
MQSRLVSLVTVSLSLLTPTHGMPLHSKRMTEGAKAGMGIGIAVVVVLVLLVVTFLIVHFRRSSHISSINRERAILAGEKNADGSDKVDKFAPVEKGGAGAAAGPGGLGAAAVPRRNKSVKDRLMGPLYRGSTIDLMPMPNRARLANSQSGANRSSTLTLETGPDGQPISGFKPWTTTENSPRASFSSKRATRMMMMM